MLSPTLRRRFISADVTFDESQSYFSPSVASDSSPPYRPLLPHVFPTESPLKPLQVYRHRQKPPMETSSLPSDLPPDPASLLIALHKCKSSCTSYPISHFLSYGHLSSSFHAFTTILNSTIVLKSVQEAMCISSWKFAMEAEMSTLFENAT